MKQLVLTLIAAAIAAPAFAGTAYVGGSVGRAKQKLEVDNFSFSQTVNGAKFVGGFQVTPRFGVEAGHVFLGETEVGGNGATIGAKPRSTYVAVTGTMPLTPTMSAFVKLGAAHTKTTVNASYLGNSGSGKETETSAIAGIGASFAIDEQVSVVVEYENFGKIVKSDTGESLKASLLSAGVRVQF